jgi:hypothetical protein
VVGRHGRAGVVGEVDDGAKSVEREVAPALVGSRQADEPIRAVVVLGLLQAGSVVLGQQRRLVVDVLPQAFFADLLGAAAVEVVLEAAEDRRGRRDEVGSLLDLDELVALVVDVAGRGGRGTGADGL